MHDLIYSDIPGTHSHKALLQTLLQIRALVDCSDYLLRASAPPAKHSAMRQKAAIALYRAVLREARHQLVDRFAGTAISIRAPVSNSQPGSYNANATPGLQYQLECLEALVPGSLAVVPEEEQLPLTYSGLKQLIKANFKANKHVQPDLGAASGVTPLDQGFAALRALPLLAYLESCSSAAITDDVLIEATSSYSHTDPPSRHGSEQWFKYRVRITNHRPHPIKVLGRGWTVSNHLGELEGFVMLAPDNGIVGQKPVIPPGSCYEYHSCTPLKNAAGPGQMQGQLMVDLLEYEGSADEAEEGLQRVAMPVAPFKLQTMAVAAAAASRSRSGAAAAAAAATTEGGAAAAAAAAAEGAEVGAERGSSNSDDDDDGSRQS